MQWILPEQCVEPKGTQLFINQISDDTFHAAKN